jgi:8-oxo-dGTP diphosphatase
MLNVVCAIVLKEGKILVTQRSEQMKLPLKWEFPGGKLETNESEIECIKRELLEELNIQIVIINKMPNSVYNYGEVVINLIPYLARYDFGEIKLLEHKAYKFVEKEELLLLDWAEADLPIVQHFLNSYYEPRNI